MDIHRPENNILLPGKGNISQPANGGEVLLPKSSEDMTILPSGIAVPAGAENGLTIVEDAQQVEVLLPNATEQQFARKNALTETLDKIYDEIEQFWTAFDNVDEYAISGLDDLLFLAEETCWTVSKIALAALRSLIKYDFSDPEEQDEAASSLLRAVALEINTIKRSLTMIDLVDPSISQPSIVAQFLDLLASKPKLKEAKFRATRWAIYDLIDQFAIDGNNSARLLRLMIENKEANRGRPLIGVESDHIQAKGNPIATRALFTVFKASREDDESTQAIEKLVEDYIAEYDQMVGHMLEMQNNLNELVPYLRKQLQKFPGMLNPWVHGDNEDLTVGFEFEVPFYDTPRRAQLETDSEHLTHSSVRPLPLYLEADRYRAAIQRVRALNFDFGVDGSGSTEIRTKYDADELVWSPTYQARIVRLGRINDVSIAHVEHSSYGLTSTLHIHVGRKTNPLGSHLFKNVAGGFHKTREHRGIIMPYWGFGFNPAHVINIANIIVATDGEPELQEFEQEEVKKVDLIHYLIKVFIATLLPLDSHEKVQAALSFVNLAVNDIMALKPAIPALIKVASKNKIKLYPLIRLYSKYWELADFRLLGLPGSYELAVAYMKEGKYADYFEILAHTTELDPKLVLRDLSEIPRLWLEDNFRILYSKYIRVLATCKSDDLQSLIELYRIYLNNATDNMYQIFAVLHPVPLRVALHFFEEQNYHAFIKLARGLMFESIAEEETGSQQVVANINWMLDNIIDEHNSAEYIEEIIYVLAEVHQRVEVADLLEKILNLATPSEVNLISVTLHGYIPIDLIEKMLANNRYWEAVDLIYAAEGYSENQERLAAILASVPVGEALAQLPENAGSLLHHILFHSRKSELGNAAITLFIQLTNQLRGSHQYLRALRMLNQLGIVMIQGTKASQLVGILSLEISDYIPTLSQEEFAELEGELSQFTSEIAGLSMPTAKLLDEFVRRERYDLVLEICVRADIHDFAIMRALIKIGKTDRILDRIDYFNNEENWNDLWEFMNSDEGASYSHLIYENDDLVRVLLTYVIKGVPSDFRMALLNSLLERRIPFDKFNNRAILTVLHFTKNEPERYTQLAQRMSETYGPIAFCEWEMGTAFHHTEVFEHMYSNEDFLEAYYFSDEAHEDQITEIEEILGDLNNAVSSKIEYRLAEYLKKKEVDLYELTLARSAATERLFKMACLSQRTFYVDFRRHAGALIAHINEHPEDLSTFAERLSNMVISIGHARRRDMDPEIYENLIKLSLKNPKLFGSLVSTNFMLRYSDEVVTNIITGQYGEPWDKLVLLTILLEGCGKLRFKDQEAEDQLVLAAIENNLTSGLNSKAYLLTKSNHFSALLEVATTYSPLTIELIRLLHTDKRTEYIELLLRLISEAGNRAERIADHFYLLYDRYTSGNKLDDEERLRFEEAFVAVNMGANLFPTEDEESS